MSDNLIAGERLNAGDAVCYGSDGKVYRMRSDRERLTEARKFLNDLDDHAGYTPSLEILKLRKILGV